MGSFHWAPCGAREWRVRLDVCIARECAQRAGKRVGCILSLYMVCCIVSLYMVYVDGIIPLRFFLLIWLLVWLLIWLLICLPYIQTHARFLLARIAGTT